MDKHLRQDQRRASLGDRKDRAHFLLNRIRSGELPRDRVRTAAALGDEAALMIFDDSALLRELGSHWAHLVLDKIDHLPIAIHWICWVLREDPNRVEDAQVYAERAFDRSLSPEALGGLIMLGSFADALELETSRQKPGPRLLDSLSGLAFDLQEQKKRIRTEGYASTDYLVICAIDLTLFNVASASGAFLRYDDLDMKNIRPECLRDNMNPGYYSIAMSIADNDDSFRGEAYKEEIKRQTCRLLDLLLE